MASKYKQPKRSKTAEAG